MGGLRWYQLLVRMLRQYVKTGLLFLLFAGIFATVFYLYDMETEAVLYAAGLCVIVILLVLCARFPRYYREYHYRQRLLENIAVSYDALPEAGTLEQEDYRNMIEALGRINNTLLTEWEKERQDSLDYYTTWVHQIKTPISVMRMTLQEEDSEEHRELMAQLFRIEQYVDMVLTYMRLGSSQTDFLFREYDLDGIIRQAVRKYAPLFIRSRIRLVYEPVDMRIVTDEKWLLFIIEQLLSNAIKYTVEGTVTIAVSPQQVLSVSDTGMGIAPEDLPRIFEKGFTGYHGRADKKATGLGLYLCKQTAAKLGIGLRVDSAPAQGSTFYLDLRRNVSEIE